MAPCASRAATTATRASSTVRPANSPAASVMRPSSPMTEISSSPCRRPISKSLGSWPGRDLQAAGAEVGLHVVVGDDRQAPPDEREHHLAPDEVAEALVVRVHRDRRVGQHRLRPHGGDHHLAAAVGQRIGDRVQRVDDALAVLHLEVGDRRAQARVPVDHVGVAVDEALLVEVDEDLQDRADVALVHREALVVVVELRAEALELLDDLAAELLAPAPHGLAERLAAELLAASCPAPPGASRPAAASRCRRGRCRGSTSCAVRACGACG